MQLLKYSFLLILFASNAFAMSFTSQVCLMGQFEAHIQNEGKYFGLVKNKLSIIKDQCNIKVKHKKILETEWKVDICREPVHIKMLSKGTLEVYKRHGDCEDSSDVFCDSWKELKKTIQDQGLIFAEGERENIQSAHGKTYCAYLLLRKYLEEGILFSKYKAPIDIFSKAEKKVVKEENNTVKPIEVKKDDKIKEAKARF